MSVKESIERHKQEVLKLRETFLTTRYEKCAELYDLRDIEKVRQNDWTVWRFLRTEKYNFDSALDKLDRAMKWRKEMAINDMNELDVPKEFYEVGGIFTYNRDREGTTLIIMRIKVNLKIQKLNKYIKDFMTYVIDRVDQQNNENGFVLMFDLTDSGIRNADLDICSYLISILRFYFPEGMKYCLVYNLPWILRSFWPIVRMWIPTKHQSLVKFANKDEIRDYIDVECLPKYLGGLCAKSFATPPAQCRSVTEMGDQLGFTNEEINEYLKIFKPNIKETKRVLTIDNS